MDIVEIIILIIVGVEAITLKKFRFLKDKKWNIDKYHLQMATLSA